ncbi:MAG: acyl carrier protein [Clostridia bacterium]|nr:acyl carrier protein [Clostridia bacterium]
MNTQERILKFFIEKNKADDNLTWDTDLLAGGYVNSLFALEIVMYLEKEFKIRIKRKDINDENFRTINNMTALVERLVK